MEICLIIFKSFRNFKNFCLIISSSSSSQSLLFIHSNLNKSFPCSVIGEISPNGSNNVALIFNKFLFVNFKSFANEQFHQNRTQTFSMSQLIPNTFLSPRQFLPAHNYFHSLQHILYIKILYY